MRRNLFYLFAAAMTMVACDSGGGDGDGPEKPGESVTINGVRWATRNVGVKGKFIDNPWDYGLLYTFEEAQTACPDGWRTPTQQEIEILAATSSEWTTVNNTNGRRFGSGNNTIFLPAAGYRTTNGSVYSQGANGYYWSSSAYSSTGGYNLYFSSSDVGPSGNDDYAFGFGVRCVRQ